MHDIDHVISLKNAINLLYEQDKDILHFSSCGNTSDPIPCLWVQCLPQQESKNGENA
jgi:hypothetical protein